MPAPHVHVRLHPHTLQPSSGLTCLRLHHRRSGFLSTCGTQSRSIQFISSRVVVVAPLLIVTLLECAMVRSTGLGWLGLCLLSVHGCCWPLIRPSTLASCLLVSSFLMLLAAHQLALATSFLLTTSPSCLAHLVALIRQQLWINWASCSTSYDLCLPPAFQACL